MCRTSASLQRCYYYDYIAPCQRPATFATVGIVIAQVEFVAIKFGIDVFGIDIKIESVVDVR